MAAIKIRYYKSGQPTKYNEEVLQHAQEYLERYRSNKSKQPYIEELALEMDVDDSTLVNWAKAKNEDGSRKYPEFFSTYKKIVSLQKFRLLEKTLFQFPAGSIFQLKANHGMMESEKKVIAGDKDEPLEIKFVEERLKPEVTE